MYHNNQQNNPILLKQLEKRRNLYTIVCAVFFLLFSITSNTVSWICFGLMGLSAGCGLLTINHYRYYKSGGRRKGGGLWWILLLIFGGIVVPWLTVVITAKISPLCSLILGVKFEG